jgi:hypothetical protein
LQTNSFYKSLKQPWQCSYGLVRITSVNKLYQLSDTSHSTVIKHTTLSIVYLGTV